MILFQNLYLKNKKLKSYKMLTNNGVQNITLSLCTIDIWQGRYQVEAESETPGCRS